MSRRKVPIKPVMAQSSQSKLPPMPLMINPRDLANDSDDQVPSSRGDSPALEVLNQIELRKLGRARDETSNELKKVLARVDHTIANYEQFSVARNVEFVADVNELLGILQDEWKKHQYQHQVTVFIVGYEKKCDNRVALIRSVNEFFTRHLNLMGELESLLLDGQPVQAGVGAASGGANGSTSTMLPEFDEDASVQAFEDALSTTKELGVQLAELNQSIISYMNEQQESHPNANVGFGNHRRSVAVDGSFDLTVQQTMRRKLERQLKKAEEELKNLSSSLQSSKKDLKMKDEQLQQLSTQLEFKSVEYNKLKLSTDQMRKQAFEEEASLKGNLRRQAEEIDKLKKHIEEVKLELEEKHMLEKRRMEEEYSSTVRELQSELKSREEELELSRRAFAARLGDVKGSYEQVLEAQRKIHREELEALHEKYLDDSKTLKEQLTTLELELQREKERRTDKNISEGSHSARERISRVRRWNESGSRSSTANPAESSESEDAEENGNVNDPSKSHSSNVDANGTASVTETSNRPADADEQPQPAGAPAQAKRKTTRKVKLTEEASSSSSSMAQKHEEKKIAVPARKTKKPKSKKAQGDTDATPDVVVDDTALKNALNEANEWRKKFEELEPSYKSKFRTMKLQFHDTKLQWDQEKKLIEKKGSEMEKLKEAAEQEAARLVAQIEELLAETVLVAQMQAEDAAHDKQKRESQKASSSSAMSDNVSELQSKVEELEAQLAANSAREANAIEIQRLTDKDEQLNNAREVSDGHSLSPNSFSQSSRTGGTRIETIHEVDEQPGAQHHGSSSSQKISSTTASQTQPLVARSPDQVYDRIKAQLEVTKHNLRTIQMGSSNDTPSKQIDQDASIVTSQPAADDAATASGQQLASSRMTVSTDSGANALVQPFNTLVIGQASFDSKVPSPSSATPLNVIAPRTLETTLQRILSADSLPDEFVAPTALQAVDQFAQKVKSYLRDQDRLIVLLALRNDPTEAKLLSELGKLLRVSEPSTLANQSSELGTSDASEDVLSVPQVLDCVYNLLVHTVLKEVGSQTTANASTNVVPADVEKIVEERVRPLMLELEQKTQRIQTLTRSEADLHQQVQNLREMGLSTNSDRNFKKPLIMFTKLDRERNSKTLQRLVQQDRASDSDIVQTALEVMQQYSNLQADRFVTLVSRYYHLKQMQQLSEMVHDSAKVNPKVFVTLSKMEDLEQKREQRWSARMKQLGHDRMFLAHQLGYIFDNVEDQQSSIFLIRPAFSLQSRRFLNTLFGIQSVVEKHSEVQGGSAESTGNDEARAASPLGPSINQNTNFVMTGVSAPSNTEQIVPSWSVGNSVAPRKESRRILSDIPKILELEVNRTLVGQRHISVALPSNEDSEGSSNYSAMRNHLTSYYPIKRPSATITSPALNG